MANATPVRIGQINEAGDVDALFLKVFAGEVLTAFSETNVFAERTMSRTISSGKSAQFPASWKGTASYHTPGVELVGSSIAYNERTILIDDLLVADRFLASIDEAKTHYDVRSEISRDVGRALARAFDSNVAQVGVLAARAAATVTGGNGGTQILAGAGVVDTLADLEEAAFAAATALDEKDVPDTDRFLYLKPEQYYLLISSGSKAINRDYAGNGSFADGTIFRLAGMQIVKTNWIPQTNVTTGPVAYRGDFTDTVGLAMHRSACGTVKLIDLAVEMGWDMRRQGTLILAKYALGHGILRPESSVEISKAAA